MTTTVNYGLRKPDLSEHYAVEDSNYNSDIIDSKMNENASGVSANAATASSNSQGVLDNASGVSANAAEIVDLQNGKLDANATAKNTEKVGSVLANNVIDGDRLIKRQNTDANNVLGTAGTRFETLNYDASNRPPSTTNGSWALTSKIFDNDNISQVAHQFITNTLLTRTKTGGTWKDWAKVWTDANDGANSGLDADLLDGNHASVFATKADLNTKLGVTATAKNSEKVGNILASKVIEDNGRVVTNPNNYLTSVKSGFYGLNNATANMPSGVYNNYCSLITAKNQDTGLQILGGYRSNQMYFRGWAGADIYDWYRIWHDGNDGSNSGLDADLLDGKHASYFGAKSSVDNLTNDINGVSMTVDNNSRNIEDNAEEITDIKNDIQALKVKPTNKTIEAVITANWTGSGSIFYQDVHNSAFKANYNILMTLHTNIGATSYSEYKKAYNLIEGATVFDGYIRFYVLKKPTTSIPVTITILY